MSSSDSLAYNAAALEALVSLPPYDATKSFSWNERLRAEGFDPAVTAEILTQARLRTAAVKKFGAEASRFLYTQQALEQASRAEFAHYHAQRYRDAAVSQVFDLGCGIGADSIAFAQAGFLATGIEYDETTAELARYNLEQLGGTVVCADASSAEVAQLIERANRRHGTSPSKIGVWLDPARRSSNKRFFHPDDFSPPLSLGFAHAQQGRSVGMKLGPALKTEHIPPGCEAQWLSYRGDVGEVCLWFNELQDQNHGWRRSAVLFSAQSDSPQCSLGTTREFGDDPAIELGPVGAYIYEVDGALLRAGLLNDFAHEHGLHQIDPDIAYLSSDHLLENPWVTSYTVKEVLPYKTKQLKQYVKANQLGALTIKKRGIKETPEEIRKSLRPQGSNSATFIVTRASKGAAAASERIVIVCE